LLESQFTPPSSESILLLFDSGVVIIKDQFKGVGIKFFLLYKFELIQKKFYTLAN
jgi:hypothetical protein